MANENNQQPTSDSGPTVEGHDVAQLFQTAVQAAAASSVASSAPGKWRAPDPETVSALLPGYEVTALLGRGGMGAVYRGVQTSLHREVAIKLLPAELGGDPELKPASSARPVPWSSSTTPTSCRFTTSGRTRRGITTSSWSSSMASICTS